MTEEYGEIKIPKKEYDKLMRMTKHSLIEKGVAAAIEAKLANDKAAALQTKLDKAEAYVEQGRAMINAIMERWYEYDV